MTKAQDGGKVVSLTHRPPLPQEIHLVLISVKGWVDPGAIVRPEGLCHWKLPMRPSGIEPATCRFVTSCLNHYVTARPIDCLYKYFKYLKSWIIKCKHEFYHYRPCRLVMPYHTQLFKNRQFTWTIISLTAAKCVLLNYGLLFHLYILLS